MHGAGASGTSMWDWRGVGGCSGWGSCVPVGPAFADGFHEFLDGDALELSRDGLLADGDGDGDSNGVGVELVVGFVVEPSLEGGETVGATTAGILGGFRVGLFGFDQGVHGDRRGCRSCGEIVW